MITPAAAPQRRLRAWLNNLPVRRKLWLFNLLTAIVAGLFAAALLLVVVWNAEYRFAISEAENKASIMAENALPALQFRDTGTAETVLRGLRQDEEVLDARIIENGGQLFARYSRPEFDKDPSPEGRIVVRVPMRTENEVLGTVELTHGMEQVIQEMLIYTSALAIATLASLLVGSYVVVRLQRAITDPLTHLTEAMAEISSGENFSRRAVVASRDELGQLNDSFNRMIEQIESRNDALNHELAERIRAEKELEHLAHHDQVTGLPNRHFFRKRTRDLLKGGALDRDSIALLFVDLDNFKYINDTFGHDQGDQMLVAVAEILSKSVRAHDMVVRFGGDEFVLLLDRIGNVETAERLGRKILEAVTQPMHLNGHEFVVTCSIGIAVAPLHASDFDELLQKADVAMYAAKTSGKNAIRIWDPAITSASSKRFTIESELRVALTRNEIELYYQPIVTLESGRIAGLEALMRWKHPTRGMVSPAEFIPVAEETGQITELGAWAMRTAFAQAAQWNKTFGRLFMAVNVSGRQFRAENFVETADAIARESGLARELCELEVTESVLMTHTANAIATLQGLADRGFTLALDDFGTGYSSMAYLKRFPLDKLKIDRSFVSELPDDLEDRAISQAIIGLAQNMSMRVLAEGIETRAQADLLCQMQCQYGQGFHFSRPLPADQLARFIAENLAAQAA
jgi:diguanylate cyclase (GGDEF)-like protein